MKKVNSITLMLMGTGFLPLALLMDNLYLKSILLVASIVMNIIAIIKNFKEKRENKF
ncbi:MAG TPA: hypothetical protein VF676_06060 [Flavobacterium sp.]|jgi:hypothetical protein